MRLGNILGLVVLSGVAAYVLMSRAQSRAATDLCESIPVGTRVESPESLTDSSLLKLMGPIRDPELPNTEVLIFCAGLTMCDVSCQIEVTDDIVTDVVFRSL